MRVVDKLAVPVILIAGGLVFLAERMNLPGLTLPAMALFGIFAILLGAGTLIQGRIQMFDRMYSRREHYSGLPARLLGVAILLFGAGIVAYAVMEWMQPGEAGILLADLVNSNRGWSILLFAIGFFTLLFGIVRLIAGSAHSREERRFLTDLWFRFQGLIGTGAGILLLAAGAWLWTQ
jgi:hypothetical protein